MMKRMHMLKSSRKKIDSLILICAGLLFCVNSKAAQVIKNQSTVILDQSQEIFFEQFLPSTFTLQLLQVKNKFNRHALVLGGVGEVDLQYWHGDEIPSTPILNYQTGNGLYLSQVTIDFMGTPTNWGMAFLSLSDSQVGQGNGTNGNYYYIKHAFILLGNLDVFPLYAAIGINTIPFGIFTGSGVWDVPLTYVYFNPQQAPQIALSYFKNNLNLNVVYYRDEVNYERHFNASFYYNNTLGNFKYTAGAGFISNLKTNSTGSNSTPNVRKKIILPDEMGDVWDFNASVNYKLLALAGEYLFAANKVSNNNNKPQTYSLGLSFTPTIYDEVTTFGICKSVSLHFRNVSAMLSGQDATQLSSGGLKDKWAASISRPLYLNNFVLGIDIERAVTYQSQHTMTYTLDMTAYL